MKNVLLLFLICELILISNISSSGQLMLPDAVRKDFAISSYKTFNYATSGSFEAIITNGLVQSGFSFSDVAIVIEKLESEPKYMYIVLEIMANQLGKSHDFVFMNLKSMGMLTENAYYLTDYIMNRDFETSLRKEEKLRAKTLVNESKKKDIETVAEFPSGMGSMFNFLYGSMRHYPIDISGIVDTQFTVSTDGSIRNPIVVKSIGGGCDEAVIKIVKLMPKWIPGTKNGEPISSDITISVKCGNE